MGIIDFNIDKVKDIKKKHLGAEFAGKRDAIRWIDGYGYDCSSEDITNFLGAYTYLKQSYEEWDKLDKTLPETPPEPTTYYKVWVNETEKGTVSLTFAQMSKVYATVREEQFGAYTVYEQKKAEIYTLGTLSEIDAVTLG